MASNGHAGEFDWVHTALERYEGALTRYAHRITGDMERARDIVQETFLRLCRQDQVELDGHLPEWLFTVCRNRALDVRRKERRMTTMTAIERGESATAVALLVEPESREAAPGDAAEQHDAHSKVLALLDGLSDNQQECIRLKFQNGLSYREISQVTGLSVSNVGYLIHTGLKRIRHQMRVEG